MCEFCDNVKDIEQYKKIDPQYRVDCIVKYKNCYCYWHECLDWYYSGTIFELYYCPKCGRKLK